MINVQSRILSLLESTKESDDKLITMIDLIKGQNNILNEEI